MIEENIVVRGSGSRSIQLQAAGRTGVQVVYVLPQGRNKGGKSAVQYCMYTKNILLFLLPLVLHAFERFYYCTELYTHHSFLPFVRTMLVLLVLLHSRLVTTVYDMKHSALFFQHVLLDTTPHPRYTIIASKRWVEGPRIITFWAAIVSIDVRRH